MDVPRIFLKPRRDARVETGHLWIFSNEIDKAEEDVQPGGLADVYSAKEKFIGRGFCNPQSLISVRLLSRKEETIDEAFILRKVRSALFLREEILPGETSYRLVFGESDGLPGIVIDRLGSVFVVQSYCLGADNLVPHVFSALKAVFPGCAILNKSDSSMRALEGLKDDVGVVEGEIAPPVEIMQGKLKFLTDPLGGQKTGFFFDQRDNRQRLSLYAKGKTVLDAYSYVGGFGLYAASGGAKAVTCVDSSQAACDLAKKNFEANGLACEVVKEDAEAFLGQAKTEKRKFDIIVLDPPALAKSKKNVFSAIRKYGQLNQAAMACLPPGGVLFSCSCSHHVGRREFMDMIAEAAFAVGRTARILEMRGQGRDHPILASMPETEYLKCAIAKID
ncbi:MAG: hypothetical protein A3A86_01235 [Elusimicrobia bacterium RIFCSPLOWO2_01_FULL_60_11]|nr:MAG: hypothetical protein A3A86_01235 [Elusimicrobia bacterium RIFCSPLOWO2_01_FULL_60_11]